MSDSKLKQNNEALHFLHDLLNHTHGLKLYLESRNGKMEQANLDLIYNEVQALENQISSQFKLFKNSDQFGIKDLVDSCQRQFEIYQLNVDLTNDVKQSDLAPIEFSFDGQVFERLIKNIAKNIYLWAKANSRIECHISEIDERVQIIFSNEIDTQIEIEKDSNGIGLLSLKRLARENGIVFQSWLSDGRWLTKILIEKVGQKHESIAC